MGWGPISKFWFNPVIISMLLGLFLTFCFDSHYRKNILFNNLDFIMLLFIIYGLFITIITYEKCGFFTAVNGFRTYFFGGFIYFLFRGYIINKNEARFITFVLIASIAVVSIELITEFILMNSFSLDWRFIPWLSGENVGVLIDSPERIRKETLFRPLGMLAYVHYTAYIIGLGILINAPLVLNMKRSIISIKFFTLLILFSSLILTTTRSVIAIVIFLLLYLVKKERILFKFKKIGKFFIVMSVGLILAYCLNVLDFLREAFSLEEAFYSSFYTDPFWNIFETNPLEIIVGRGFPVGGYERLFFDMDLITEEGFHFNQISDEIHFLYYLDRIGIIGGILFVLQIIIAFKMGLKVAKLEKNNDFRNYMIGFSLCPLLFLFSSVHILHTDVVMQFFNYTILGTIGSFHQVYSNEPPITEVNYSY